MFFGILALAACTTMSDEVPREPRVDLPSKWALSDTADVSTDLAKYWTLLGDPLLSDLVEQAIVANRELAIGAARIDQARAALKTARAGYAPTISGTGGFSRDIGSNARDGVQFSIGTEVSWELDLFGQIEGNVLSAEKNLLASGYSLADLQRLIVGQVAIAAISARATAEQLRLTRQALAFQDDNLQIAQWRNQAGLTSSLDVEQARTQRAQTAATIPQLEANLVATANTISTLIGEPPGRVYGAIAEGAAAVPAPALLKGFAPPAEVLRRRPDVRFAEAVLAADTARIGVARAQLLPLVRLSGSIGAGSTTLGRLFDIVTGNLFAGVSALIFDGGRARSQVDSARAQAQTSLAGWEQTILDALEDVETAAVDQRTSDERVQLTQEALNSADVSALLARSQYQAGLTDFQTVLISENQLLSAQNQLVAAQADRASAFVRLTQALGGGWSADEYDLPLPINTAQPANESPNE